MEESLSLRFRTIFESYMIFIDNDITISNTKQLLATVLISKNLLRPYFVTGIIFMCILYFVTGYVCIGCVFVTGENLACYHFQVVYFVTGEI